MTPWRPDISLMEEVFRMACESKPARERDPKVGAALRLTDGSTESAYRGEHVDGYSGEQSPGDHAEFTLLHKKIRSKAVLTGATLYTTLEPCTTRYHDKMPCADWIISKKITSVVIGLLDPNRSICGKGYWRLIDSGIQVAFFPPEFAQKIIRLNRQFVHLYRSALRLSTSFADLIHARKDYLISPFPGLGILGCLELQSSPDLREGWSLAQVRINHDDGTAPVGVPPEQRDNFERYTRENWERRRLYDDGEKFMIVRNPTSFEEAPTLALETKSARYSVQAFYMDEIGRNQFLKQGLIRELVTGSLEARFAHGTSLQMVVVTRDHRLLITQRAKKTGVFGSLWSCSVEEDLQRQDIEAGASAAFLHWAKRLLREELGLTENHYHSDDIKLLSVFLETVHLNIAFCVLTEVCASAGELETHFRAKRGDIEFTNYRFLDLDQKLLLREIFAPTLEYHPTSGYRLLITFLKYFGEPDEADLAPYR